MKSSNSAIPSKQESRYENIRRRPVELLTPRLLTNGADLKPASLVVVQKGSEVNPFDARSR